MPKILASWKGLTFLIAVASLQSVSLAQDICVELQEGTCVEQMDDPGLEGLRCLEIAIACEKNDEVIAALYTTDQKLLKPMQNYFLGFAFHNKSIGVRSESNRCEFSRAAKMKMTDFLQEVYASYEQLGNFNHFSLSYIRHATRILSDNTSFKNCLNGFPTSSELQLEAQKTGHDFFMKVLFDSGTADTSGGVSFEPIQNELQGFINKTSSFISGIGLRSVEVNENRLRVDSIAANYKFVFGGVSEGDIISAPTKLLEITKKVDSWKARVCGDCGEEPDAGSIEGKFFEAVGNNQDSFAEIQGTTEKKVKNLNSEVGLMQELYRTNFPFLNGSTSGLMGQFSNTLESTLKTDQHLENYKSILEQFKLSNYPCPSNDQWRWYCREGDSA